MGFRTTDIMSLPPELLEMILVEVPAFDILTACRAVCKHWRIFVDTSFELRTYSRTGMRLAELSHQLEIATRSQDSDTMGALGKKRSDDAYVITELGAEALTLFWTKILRIPISAPPNPTPDFAPKEILEIYKRFLLGCQNINLVYPPSHQLSFISHLFTYDETQHKREKRWLLFDAGLTEYLHHTGLQKTKLLSLMYHLAVSTFTGDLFGSPPPKESITLQGLSHPLGPVHKLTFENAFLADGMAKVTTDLEDDPPSFTAAGIQESAILQGDR